MALTTVVNIRDTESYDVYIGRAVPRKGLKKSPFANPFKVGKDGTREEVIEKYREWLLDRPELVEMAERELKGKVLGCWCKPAPCHGDVLASIVDGESDAGRLEDLIDEYLNDE